MQLVYLSAGPVGIRTIDVTHPHDTKMIASALTRGSARALALKFPHLYVAVSAKRILIFDVSKPGELPVPREVDTKIAPRDLAVWGDHLYVSFGKKGLRVYHIHSDGSLEELKESFIDERIDRVFTGSDYLYAVFDREILKIFDLKDDPRNLPKPLATYDTGARIQDVLEDEKEIFLALDRDGCLALDVSHPPTLTEMIRFDTLGLVKGLALSEQVLFVADGKKGLLMMDLADPESPRQLGQYDTWGNSTQVQVQGAQVLLADGFSGLRVLSARAMLSMNAEYKNYPFASLNSVATGQYIYSSEGGNGVRVYASDGRSLRAINLFDTPGEAWNVSIDSARNLAFVADLTGVLVLDISHPEQSIPLLGEFRKEGESEIKVIQHVGSHLFLAQGSKGVRSVDVSDPAKPRLLEKASLRGQALDLDVFGNDLFVAAGAGGLQVVNITDRKLPTQIAELSLPGEARAIDVAFLNPGIGRLYAYLAASQAGLCVADISVSNSPRLLDCMPTQAIAQDVVVDETNLRLYLLSDQGLLTAYQLFDPAKPIQISSMNLGIPASSVAFQGGQVLISAMEDGFYVVDFSDLNNPTLVSIYDFPANAHQMDIHDPYAYLVDGEYGFHILDISNRKNFREIGSLLTGGAPEAVVRSGSYAYIANNGRGLDILDISNPARPYLVKNLNPGWHASHIAVRDQIAFLSLNEAGLAILDISIPSETRVISQLQIGLPGPVIWAAPYGSEYILLACEGAGVVSVYIKNPAAPEILGTYSGIEDIRSLTVYQDLALVAGGRAGFLTLDISRPIKVSLLKHIQTKKPAISISTFGRLAFVAEGDGGVQVFDMSSSAEPVEVVEGNFPGSAVQVWTEWLPPEEKNDDPGRYRLYLADEDKGLRQVIAKQSASFKQIGIYETPGTAGFYEVFNNIMTWTNQSVKILAAGSSKSWLSPVGDVMEYIRMRLETKIKEWAKKLGTQWPQTGASEKATWTIRKVLFGDLLFVLVLGLFLLVGLFSQHILPVRGLPQRWQAVSRLYAYLLHRHGILARVRNGEFLRHRDTENWTGRGVVFVDLASGIALEKRPLAVPLWLNIFRRLIGQRQAPANAPFGVDQTRTPISLSRAVGPGLIFAGKGHRLLSGSWWDEILVGSVDLRKQERVSELTRAVTRDGIEVEVRMISVFTLGEPPEVLKVTYDGDRSDYHNLRVIKTKQGQGAPTPGRRRRLVEVFESLADELDDDDKQEIHRFVSNPRNWLTSSAPGQNQAIPPGRPYLFDPGRVFSAITARARLWTRGEGRNARILSADTQPVESIRSDRLDWSQLPLQAGVEVFRNLLVQEIYDNLYNPTSPEGLRIWEFRTDFGVRVRNLGVLAFQYYQRKDDQVFSKGQEMEGNGIQHSPVRVLRTPKILRSRGIKMINASFIELNPVDPNVRQRMFNYWESRRKRDSEKVRSELELSAHRIRYHAQVEAQRDMMNSLNAILEMDIPREAVALRVFQSLEAVAADPTTRQFLPQEMIEMLQTLRMMLIPEDGFIYGSGSDGSSSTPPRQSPPPSPGSGGATTPDPSSDPNPPV